MRCRQILCNSFLPVCFVADVAAIIIFGRNEVCSMIETSVVLLAIGTLLFGGALLLCDTAQETFFWSRKYARVIWDKLRRPAPELVNCVAGIIAVVGVVAFVIAVVVFFFAFPCPRELLTVYAIVRTLVFLFWVVLNVVSVCWPIDDDNENQALLDVCQSCDKYGCLIDNPSAAQIVCVNCGSVAGYGMHIVTQSGTVN